MSRQSRLRVILVLGALVIALSVPAAGAAGQHKLTLYTVANGAQYLNNGDDRGRGIDNNPFDAAQLKLRPTGSAAGDGPFPGDVGVFTLSLYSDANLQKSIGSGAYTCYYNYAKRALCEAYYEFTGKSGMLVASGIVDFNNTARFKLIVTGGTNTYRDAHGELAAAPVGRAERVDFLLLG